jgi:AcrR family transcriptional regulator
MLTVTTLLYDDTALCCHCQHRKVERWIMADDMVAEGAGAAEQAAPQKAYHHQNLRAALIEAGLAILSEEGADALTLRAAARRVGVSHNAPYRHFADKDALLAAIAEEGFETLAREIERAIAEFADDPRRSLEEAGWTYVQFALAHPDHLRVMFSGLAPDPQTHPALREAGTRAFAQLVGVIAAGQQTGVFVAEPARRLAVAAWALVHGLALLLTGGQLPPDIRKATSGETLTRLSIRTHIAGLAR